jgi:hypothetical protein
MVTTNDLAAARAPAAAQLGESRAAERAGERNDLERHVEVPVRYNAIK